MAAIASSAADLNPLRAGRPPEARRDHDRPTTCTRAPLACCCCCGAAVATTTSTANVDLVRSLVADVVIDYKKEDFSHVLRDYDVVLNSLDKVTLEKSLRVLKPGGQLISISGPPDAAFARSVGASWVLK